MFQVGTRLRFFIEALAKFFEKSIRSKDQSIIWRLSAAAIIAVFFHGTKEQ